MTGLFRDAAKNSAIGGHRRWSAVAWTGTDRRQALCNGTNVLAYLRTTRMSVLLIAPIVYAVSLPFLLLDAWVWLDQALCFPVFGMSKARRGDYMVLDRYRRFVAYGDAEGYATGLPGLRRALMTAGRRSRMPRGAQLLRFPSPGRAKNGGASSTRARLALGRRRSRSCA